MWLTYRGWMCCWLRCRYGKQCAKDFETEISEKSLVAKPCFRVPQVPVFINDIPKGEKSSTGIHVVTHRQDPVVWGGVWTLRSFVYQPSQKDPLVLLGTFIIPLSLEAKLSCDCPLFARSCLVLPPPTPPQTFFEPSLSKPWIDYTQWIPMSQYAKDIECIKNRINDLEGKLAGERLKVGQLAAENKDLKAQLARPLPAPVPLPTGPNILEGKVNQLQSELATLKAAQPAKDKELAALKNANDQAQRQIAELKNIGNLKGQEADAKTAALNAAQAENDRLKKQIANAGEEAKRKQTECDKAFAELRTLSTLCPPTAAAPPALTRPGSEERVSNVPGPERSGALNLARQFEANAPTRIEQKARGGGLARPLNNGILYRKVQNPTLRPSLRTAGAQFSSIRWLPYQLQTPQSQQEQQQQHQYPQPVNRPLSPIHYPVRLPQTKS